MSRIFISYKRVDKDKVFKIKDQIESALGEKCWIDLDGIESDAVFKRVIIKAINNCEIVLFMYSKSHSKIQNFENDWTVRELAYASAKNKRIVFINLDGTSLTDEFVFDYGMKQQVDGTKKESIEHLIYDLKNWLNGNEIADPSDDKAIENTNILVRPNPVFNFFSTYTNKKMLPMILGIIILAIFALLYPYNRTTSAPDEQALSEQQDSQNISIELAIPFKYLEDANRFSEGLARIKRNGKYGFINKNGDEVIPCKFEYAGNFMNERALIKINGKYGYIDKDGLIVIPCTYEKASWYYEGLACVKRNGKYGCIDKTGEEVIPCTLQYDNDFYFSDGLAQVTRNGKHGYIDKSGNEVIPCQFDGIIAGSFNEGLAVVYCNDKRGEVVIDKRGNVVSEESFLNIKYFSEGLASIMVKDKWGQTKHGYIDRTGSIVILCIYDEAEDFSEGLAFVQKEGNWYFINREGEEVLQINCDPIQPTVKFHEGVARICIDDKYGYIDKYGRELTPFIFDTAFDFCEGYACVEKDGQYGYLKIVKE